MENKDFIEPVAHRTRKRNKKSETIPEEEFFISDEDIHIKCFTLQQLFAEIEEENSFKKRKFNEENIESNYIPMQLPEQIFDLPPHLIHFVEKENSNYEEFLNFVKCDRSKWNSKNYYRKLFQSVISPAISMGRASRTKENENLLKYIISNRIYTSMNVLLILFLIVMVVEFLIEI